MKELIIRSRDLEKLSVRSCNEFKCNHSVSNVQFDNDGKYIPSKEYIKYKKKYVMDEQKLKNSRNGRFYLTAKKETAYRVNKLYKSIEIQIFK